MIKRLKYLCIFLVLVLVGVVCYEKTKVRVLDYEKFWDKTSYEFSTIESFYNSSYSKGLKDFFYLEPTSLDDLIKHSEYVLKVRVNGKEVLGEGILNHAIILNVIKGDLKENNKIQFYDLVVLCRPLISATYIAGTTPLEQKQEYYIFLKKPKFPNKKDTYIYSSLEYGYFKVDSATRILYDYNPYNESFFSLNHAEKYDFISLVQDENYYFDMEKEEGVQLEKKDYTNYLNIKNEIIEKYEN